MAASSKSTLAFRNQGHPVAAFRRRLSIPVSGSAAESRVRRLSAPAGAVPARGRIVLRIHGSPPR